MKVARVWLVAVAFCGLLTNVVYSDEDIVTEVLREDVSESDPALSEDEDLSKAPRLKTEPIIHLLTDIPGASKDISTAYYIPEYPDVRFRIGATVAVLCHFRNNGKSDVVVKGIAGSTNSKFDFNFYIQNHTAKALESRVEPNAEFTYEYPIKIHESLEPIEYQIALTIFYEDKRYRYASTFFNETVELFYPPSLMDIGAVIRTILGISFTVVIFGLLFVYGGFSNKFADSKLGNLRKMFDPTSTKKVEKDPSAPPNDDGDWTAAYLGNKPHKRKGRK